jgi:hypothetical protein
MMGLWAFFKVKLSNVFNKTGAFFEPCFDLWEVMNTTPGRPEPEPEPSFESQNQVSRGKTDTFLNLVSTFGG